MDRLMSAIEEIHLIELDVDHEPKCQSFHDVPGNLICSVTPTHRASNCIRGPFMVCDAYVARVARDLASAFFVTCIGCSMPARDCWTVVPL